MSASSNIGTAITPEDLLAHSAWLQRLARRLVDPNTAEDLVQETWATAVRTRPERDRPLRPWLAEVLRNLARMRARSAGRWQARAHRVGAAEEGALPSPEELLTFHEAQRMVAEAVARLEEPYRSTVLLCYAQEIEPSEIARRQGIPGGTVRWRLKHGLDQVRARDGCPLWTGPAEVAGLAGCRWPAARGPGRRRRARCRALLRPGQRERGWQGRRRSRGRTCPVWPVAGSWRARP